MTSIGRPFSTTCVFYEEGDSFGSIIALISLAPIFIIVSLTTLLISRRDVHTLFLIIGKLLDDQINSILKHYIAQERPQHTLDKWNSLYGMPSNHSQFMCFLLAYSIGWIFQRWYIKNNVIKYLFSFGIFIGTGMVMFSRVYLRYHTWEQVIAGGIIGLITGSLWYFITEVYLRPIVFPWIVNSTIGKYLWLRDVSNISILSVEYEATLASIQNTKQTNTDKYTKGNNDYISIQKIK